MHVCTVCTVFMVCTVCSAPTVHTVQTVRVSRPHLATRHRRVGWYPRPPCYSYLGKDPIESEGGLHHGKLVRTFRPQIPLGY
jgi:hypothetical protein